VLGLVGEKETTEKVKQTIRQIDVEVRDLEKNGITIKNKHYVVQVEYSADYKMLCEMCGHGGANCKYFCIYCKKEKKDLLDPSDSKERTEKDILESVAEGKIRTEMITTEGQKEKSLVMRSPSRLSLDLLHVLLRVFGLYENIREAVINRIEDRRE